MSENEKKWGLEAKSKIVQNMLKKKLHSSATNRLIKAKDHASVQINVGDVNAEGRLTGTYSTYAFCGFVRREAESDDSLNRLATEDGCKFFFSLSHSLFPLVNPSFNQVNVVRNYIYWYEIFNRSQERFQLPIVKKI